MKTKFYFDSLKDNFMFSISKFRNIIIKSCIVLLFFRGHSDLSITNQVHVWVYFIFSGITNNLQGYTEINSYFLLNSGESHLWYKSVTTADSDSDWLIDYGCCVYSLIVSVVVTTVTKITRHWDCVFPNTMAHLSRLTHLRLLLFHEF